MAALAGVSAALVGLGVAELLSALLRVRVSPVLAVGEAIIEITPGALAERAIDAVGRADKPLLVTGVLVGVLAVSAFAGVVSIRYRSAGVLIMAAQAGLASLAAMSRAESSPYDLLPPLVAGAASILTLELLLRRVPATGSAHAGGSTAAVSDVGRRRFLGTATGAVGVAVLLGLAGRWAATARSGVESARRQLDLRLTAARVPPGSEVDVAGMSAWHTPTDEFYRIDTALAVPLVDPGDWQLRVHGMVDRELVLSYDDLVERGLVDAWVTLCCVSNPVGGDLVGNTRWSGVRIDDLLAEVGVSTDADALLSTSKDGWTCGTPLAELTDGREALLAVAMDGEPLPLEHGFPVRMVVPGLYGYVSGTKWVTDWEVTRFDQFSAYWTDRGWSSRGPVKTTSRIDVPNSGASVAAGPVAVAGVAFAQHRGIDRVEVRVDDGAWEPARLADVPSTDTWVQWVYDWEATEGEHTITVRATDADGDVQSGDDVDVVPNGAEGWHDITVTVG